MSAMTPPRTHAPSVRPGVWTRWATTCGFRKIPDPMIPPITIMTPEKSPTRRAYATEPVVGEGIHQATPRRAGPPLSWRMPEHPTRARVVAAFAAVYLIWGSTYLAIRVAIDSVPPFVMAGIRFIIAGLALFLWARSRGAPAPSRRNWIGALVIGLLLLTAGNGAVVWTEQRVPSGLTALLVATVPVWTVIVEWVGAGRERPRGRTVLGLLVGLAGVGR